MAAEISELNNYLELCPLTLSSQDNLNNFILEMFQILNKFEKVRFALPWRWKRWLTNYKETLNKFQFLLKSMTGMADTSNVIEAKKKLNKNIEKINQRIQKMQNAEYQQWFKELGLTGPGKEPKKSEKKTHKKNKSQDFQQKKQ